MSTKNSPLIVLRTEARGIATNLKRAADGVSIGNDPQGKIAASKAKGFVKIAIVMDDKTITLDIPWKDIEKLTHAQLSEFILDLMMETRKTTHQDGKLVQ